MSGQDAPQDQREASERALVAKQNAPAPHHLDQLMSAKEVCEALRLSPATLYRGVNLGWIPPPLKIGASSRWPASEIAALVERAKQARAQEAA